MSVCVRERERETDRQTDRGRDREKCVHGCVYASCLDFQFKCTCKCVRNA